MRPLRHAAGFLGRVARRAHLSENEQHRINNAVGSLLIAVMRADGRETPAESELLDGLFQTNFGPREAARIRESLAGLTEVNADECVQALIHLERDEAHELVQGMYEIAYADDESSPRALDFIREASRALGVDDNTREACRLEILDERGKRAALVKSGAGIVVALVVIAVFVFTATFLKSVLFGLMLAYFFLPLQRWFQFYFYPSSIVQQALACSAKLERPFIAIARSVKTRFGRKRVVHEVSDHDRRVTQACHATLTTLAIAALLIAASLTWVSSRYLAAWQGNSPAEASERPASAQSSTDTSPPSASPAELAQEANAESDNDDAIPAYITPSPAPVRVKEVAWLERYRPLLERSDFLRISSEVVKEYLTDDGKKKELLGMVVHNLQPLLLRASGFLGTLANLLLDALMTLFFFSFFLQRIAAGQTSESGQGKPTSRYLVETIFQSGWLPAAGADAMHEAHLILAEILHMLQTWVKGYLWIIILESILYITAFAILGVPYFPILGILAGMTVLLPFIGPIASFLLTLIVTFAFQSPSVTTLVAISVVYLVCHVIIEQLILFPALIGEALGLNALETIIVVLLGGVVAGLAGAVFAIPVAAVLKYLIPHVYQSVARSLRGSQSERAT
ncbi:MAG: AI-2E family transporter [Pirellulales bacterium]